MRCNMSYVAYEQLDEVRSLDRNTYDGNTSTTFPNNIYMGEVQHQPYYACSRPRDTDFNYIIGVERDDHPNHFSRFGYARGPLGGHEGAWPGRYATTPGCEVGEPPNMAPKRFYEPEHTGSFSVLSRGGQDYIDSKRF